MEPHWPIQLKTSCALSSRITVGPASPSLPPSAVLSGRAGETSATGGSHHLRLPPFSASFVVLVKSDRIRAGPQFSHCIPSQSEPVRQLASVRADGQRIASRSLRADVHRTFNSCNLCGPKKGSISNLQEKLSFYTCTIIVGIEYFK